MFWSQNERVLHLIDKKPSGFRKQAKPPVFWTPRILPSPLSKFNLNAVATVCINTGNSSARFRERESHWKDIANVLRSKQPRANNPISD